MFQVVHNGITINCTSAKEVKELVDLIHKEKPTGIPNIGDLSKVLGQPPSTAHYGFQHPHNRGEVFQEECDLIAKNGNVSEFNPC